MNGKTLSMLVAGAIGVAAAIPAVFTKPYDTMVTATVLEEKVVQDGSSKNGSASKDGPYILYVQIPEDGNRYCTLHVATGKDIPTAVLQEVISPGSTIALKYWNEKLLWRQPTPVYDVGCFGSVASDMIEVIDHFASSETAKQKLQDKLEAQKAQELRRAQREIGEYHAASKW